MFTSHITRPLRWAIPLAVLGVIVAVLWYVRPLEVTIGGDVVDCRDPGLDLVGGCRELRTGRFLFSGLILVLGVLPLVVVAIRACVWSADTLHSLREEVRRLRERLDSDT